MLLAALAKQALRPLRPLRLCLAASRPLHCAAPLRGEELTVAMPSVAESISEGVVSAFEKKIGEAVAADEAVIMVETDKTTVPVQAPKAGVVTKFLVKIDDTIKIGAPMFTMTVGEAAAATATAAASAPAAPAPQPVSGQHAAAAPKASTAPQTAKAEKPAAKAEKPAAAAPAAPSPKPSPEKSSSGPASASTFTPGGVTRVKMRPIRKRTAQRLKEAQNTAAMLTTFNEIDMSNIMDFRNKYKDAVLKKHNVKLGFMSAFLKAASAALVQEPSVNGYIDVDGETIVYHDYVNISVAVATPKGLVVPVIRNVHQMNYIQIEKAIAEMGEKARVGELAIEDMDGGTFTVSNGGVFGSLMGTPIINPPQSAILGMHGIFDRPVAINGKVEIRPMMYVALTYDHRLVDGREAVTFLRKIKEGVEDPRTLLLE